MDQSVHHKGVCPSPLDGGGQRVHCKRVESYPGLPGSQTGGHIGGKILVRTDGAGGTKKLADNLHTRGFAFSLRMRVNEKIGMLVSRLSYEVNHGVIRPGADDGFPTGTRMIVRVEYPAAGCQPCVTDVDGCRATAFITTSPGRPQVLDLRHRGRGHCEQRIKDSKDAGLTAVPHHSFATNRVRIHAVNLAGMLSSWARLLCATPEELRKAKQAAHQRREHGYCPGENAKEQRKHARSWW